MTFPFGLLRLVRQPIRRYVSSGSGNTPFSANKAPNLVLNSGAPFARYGPFMGPIAALIPAAQLLLILHAFSTYVIELSSTTGPSMWPTLAAHGEWLAISKSYRRGRGINVGDMVDFMHPLVPGAGAVKRVVGMPGDFVVVDHVKDDMTTYEEGSMKQILLPPLVMEKRMMQIPEGHCWLLGDNATESRDSRTYGPIPLALIRGKVVAKVLPWSQRGWIANGVENIKPGA